MTQTLLQCENLQEQVDCLLQLLRQEASLRQQDITAVQASLKKAIAPEFQIVFAGAFGAGKSMLINALLERELLYSAEGHATGTECSIAYAPPDRERVILTFLSEAEVREQASVLSQQLGLAATINVRQADVISLVQQGCEAIIEQEGGKHQSDRAKQAKALLLLLEGYVTNRDRISTQHNGTYSMEHFNFSNLKEAASYVRRSSNSAVLKRVEYFCHHPLLQDGNLIIDTPGIDAPVKRDAALTYEKIENPDTSAVICVFKVASSGEMSLEEIELVERIRRNPGIRDRVFYVFNRIDETWYDPQLQQQLELLISSDFRDSQKVYKTSSLLGFYGSSIKQSSGRDRYGLDTLFSDSIKGANGREETPQFVSEFNRYCANSGKLSPTRFRIAVNSYESPTENYVRIIAEQGKPLIEQLILDSGIDEFRQGIARYLAEEKRPKLFQNLADDLEDLCIQLRTHYQEIWRELDNQPREIEAMKLQELQQLNQELQKVGQEFRNHITEEVNLIVTHQCDSFEMDFRQLQSRMMRCLDELIDGFSVEDAYSRATRSHPRNSTTPLIAILVEALYYLANQLEDTLVESIQSIIATLFQGLKDRVRKSEYYRQLYRLLGNDGGIEQQLKNLEQEIAVALINAARVECDRFVRESPRFYDEGIFSIYQFRQILQQTPSGYDCESMVETEPAIRQLLRLDFEPKVSQTIRRTFRQTVNQTLKNHLLPMAERQADEILQRYTQAHLYLEQSLEQESEEKIAKNQRFLAEIEEKIRVYNQAVTAINRSLQSMQLYEHLLPAIANSGEGTASAMEAEEADLNWVEESDRTSES